MRNIRLIILLIVPSLLLAQAPGGEVIDKLHPRILEMDLISQDRTEVIIILAEDQTMPELPALKGDLPPTHPTNRAVLAARSAAIENVRVSRRASQSGVVAAIQQAKGRLKNHYWLINAVFAEVPMNALKGIAARPDVVAITPSVTGYNPPPTIALGRSVIRSDYLRNFGGGYFAMLDTGVRASHDLFENPDPYSYYFPKFSQLDLVRDCVHGTSNNCATGLNLNPADEFNHGTATASILAGSSMLGNDYLGVTDIYLNSFKVYSLMIGLEIDASVRGFEAAVATTGGVIVAEMQHADRTSTNPILIAANNAFDTGSPVIAAAGNEPHVQNVAVPGLGRGVIAVGARDAGTLAQYESQAVGPGLDGRIKPDIQGPTNTRAASYASDTATMVYSGTSGATPYVGAAAALVTRWLSWPSQAGKVYATLIALGDDLTPDQVTGAGMLRLPTGPSTVTSDWTIKTDWTTVGQGQAVNIPFTPSCCNAIYRDLDVALWWSTDNVATANLRLDIVNPSGQIVASSDLPLSAWEKARVAGNLAAGTWNIRITGINVSTPQQVFYSRIHRTH